MINKKIFFFATGTMLAPQLVMAQKQLPNILIFIADDWGWEESGAYGNNLIKTPNIDRLAAQGMRFDNFYLTASSSSPSRSSILTGMYPHNTNAMNLHENMPDYTSLIPDALRSKGYYTMLVGKSHGTNTPVLRAKFDFIADTGRNTSLTMDDLWQKAIKERPDNQPFFMFAASHDPHRPYTDSEFADPYTPEDVTVPPYLQDSPEMRAELIGYYNEITRFDKHVGQVIDMLAQEGVLDNTLIIVMSDNGRPFHQSKSRVNVQGLKSAFIVRYPAFIESGCVTKSLASAVDIAPTVLDVAGLEKSAGMQGFSMVPILKDKEHRIRKYAFGEHNWHVFKAFERAVITEECLYIRNWLPHLTNPAVFDVIKMPSHLRMKEDYEKGKLSSEQSDTFIVPRAPEELFDTRKDMHCLHNLAKNKKQNPVLIEMRLALDTWMNATGDVFPGEGKLKPDRNDRITGDIIK
ncbi:arylsulfatase A-like enzyme [Dysgonomonas hofstadii]|uniref:Arylsulfatase A-like enzyme n=1 Tax=Dysgonomonas hofstadii TaxID=637886 RepID=A0A840CLZ3_9BACT|nr:sulfatase [Dysgonomonas hofstadii]MBB4034494.1 arylsulfatase A-like enzyme [Dysgonomonas hofstadii]